MDTVKIAEVNPIPTTESEELALDKALKCYLARKNRSENPSGHFDSGGRWYPDLQEKCIFCNGIRPPSRSFPYSLLTHCRSMTHIAQLFDVSEFVLRKSVNAYKKSLKNLVAQGDMP